MSSEELRKAGIKTVEGANRPNPFPKKGASPKMGGQYPRQSGIEPKVVRGDALTPILPKGMVASGGIIDESVNGGQYKF